MSSSNLAGNDPWFDIPSDNNANSCSETRKLQFGNDLRLRLRSLSQRQHDRLVLRTRTLKDRNAAAVRCNGWFAPRFATQCTPRWRVQPYPMRSFGVRNP